MPLSSEKPFGCLWCPTRFTRKEHKLANSWVDAARRAFPCSHCSRSFLRKDVLVRHEKSIHGESSVLRDYRRARPPLAARNSPGSDMNFDDSNTMIEALDVQLAQTGHGSSDQDSFLVYNNSNAFTGDELSNIFMDSTTDIALSSFSIGAANSSSLVDILQDPFTGGGVEVPILSETQHTWTNPSEESTSELIEYIEASTKSQSSIACASLIKDAEIDRLREILQAPALHELGFVLSKLNMQRFFRGYFRFFHPHVPLIHIPTLQASTCPEALLLSMCATGAIYTFDHADALRLYKSAKFAFEIQSAQLPYNTRLQVMLLLAMFGSFSGEEPLWNQSVSFQIQLAKEFRSSPVNLHSSLACSWESWIEAEGLKRSLYIILCYLGLMNASLFATDVLLDFDFPMELPYDESLWVVETSEKWQAMRAQACVLPSFNSAFQYLVSGNSSPPPQLSLLASGALMAALFAYICRVQSIAFGVPPHLANGLMDGCSAALFRWRAALPSVQDDCSSLDVHPSLAVASLLLWNAAFIQLYVDKSSSKSAKTAAFGILNGLQDDDLYQLVPRSPEMTIAMRHALIWIRGPIGHGIQFLAKTGCLDVNISHCLLGFHGTILLIRWLYTLEVALESGLEQTPTAEEQDLVDSIQASIAQSNLPSLKDLPLSKACAQVWAEVMTSVTTTWEISGFLGRYLAKFT
ncbi:hypothetical protein IFR04_015628 [Cadophora malorum]|uniref:C2H2-type domain-containing protein n=1 Tax=Cadophora malorum TaxID=108018 RepID=A0A8H7VYB2_9HELO|nr:hypothetical protein IFR04_015628 [Cadophora malorum]